MTDPSPTTGDAAAPSAPPADTRPYSPGLEGVVGAESAIGLVDGKNGRLLYRGYPIGQLVARGTYAEVADLLWTGEWHPGVQFHPAPVPEPVLVALRALPHDAHPMDALRTAVSVWGATQKIAWPPTPEQARALTAFSPSALAAFDRIRRGLEPIQPDESLDLAGGFLQQLTGKAPDRDTARALEAYFIVGAEHGLNASTFTARVITATRSDLASAVVGAIGALKGPLHGGAPAEVVNQLHEIGSPERAEAWVRETVAAGGRIMGFGHRVYRAYDPRAAALRQVAEAMDQRPGVAGPGDPGRGCRPARPGRAQARPGPQDQRRVLRRGGAPGRRPDPGSLPGHVRPRPTCRLDRPCHRAGRGQQAHPPGHALHRRGRARPARLSSSRPPGGRFS